MYRNQSVAIVIPGKNESGNILRVLSGLPGWVDKAYVVDDGSTDGMYELVEKSHPDRERIILIRHEKSKGVGGAIAAGYARARDDGIDCAVVMAGDGQMDPADLPAVIDPVVMGIVDYCKGNRFAYPRGLSRIPPVRLFGNFFLSFMTKVASGYWHVTDTQTGYTAINLASLKAIDVENIYPAYGCPNDILIKLNIAGSRVGEVPVNPLYGVGEKSKMRIPQIIFPILGLLIAGWFKRLYERCTIMEGNPMVLGVAMAFFLFLASGCIGAYLALKLFVAGVISNTALVALALSSILGLQFAFYVMQSDFISNRDRCVSIDEIRFRLAAMKHHGA